MKPIVVDAFTETPGGGNPAGVVILEDAGPAASEMQALAAKLGYSETAFVARQADGSVGLRYFTPSDEVPLCGHATVGAFWVLFRRGLAEAGRRYVVHTGAGEIEVDIADGLVWMDMAPPRETGELSAPDAEALYAMFGLAGAGRGGLRPAMADTGLPDIMMPLASAVELTALAPDFDAITSLSEKLGVTGVHAFCLGAGEAGTGEADAGSPPAGAPTARCRNFAPLYAINEEAATGTSNGALTYYLYRRGLVKAGEINLFAQGEAMGLPSKIYTRLTDTGGQVRVRVGGTAVIHSD